MSWKSALLHSRQGPSVSPTPQPVVQEPKPADIIKPPTEPKSQVTERPTARTDQRPNGKRIITRNSFEIYEDQMESLRKLSYYKKMEGNRGSMSGMVREAIDTFLLNTTPGK